MRLTLIRLLGDHREQVQFILPHLEAGLLGGFPHCALEGRLADRHLQLAANRGPDAEIRLLGPQQEQLLARAILDEHEDADFIRQGG